MRRAVPRVALAVLFSAILAVGAVLPAAAEGPVYRELTSGENETLYGLCDFPVEFTIERMTKWVVVWYQPDGTWVVRYPGGGLFTWSNQATGITLRTELHGNITEVYPPEGGAIITWTGNHVVPPLSIVGQGRTQLIYASPDVLLSASTTGHYGSLCEALDP